MTARCNASTEPRKVVTGGATSPLPDSPLLNIISFFLGSGDTAPPNAKERDAVQ